MKKINPYLISLVAGLLLLGGCAPKESTPLSCDATDTNDLCTNHSSPQSSLIPIPSSEEELKEYTNLPSESMIQVVDFEAAKRLNIAAYSLPGVPGKCSPIAAARVIADEIETILKGIDIV